ncbi:hypothetical protein [Pseudomonas sp. GZD-209]|uniref:hypothetical protein n=1 Tax=Pseudomonas sp. GZD-209 TaxID=3404807 RepID=UPI003BB56F64
MIEPRVGAQYKLDNQIHAIITISEDFISLCSVRHHHHRFITPIDFQIMVDSGKLELHKRTPSETSRFGRLKSLSAENLKRIDDHKPFVELVLNNFGGRITVEAQHAIQVLAKKLNRSKPPSISSVRLWVKRFLASNRNPAALARKKNRRRPPQLPRVTEELMKHYINTVYLQLHRPTLAHAYRLFKGHLIKENLERARQNLPPLIIPCYYTMRRRAHILDPYYVTKLRYGVEEANRRSKSSGSLYVNKESTAVTIFDSYVCSNMVIDSRTGRMGRPILSAHLLPSARYCSGYDIDFGAPCGEKMMRATKSSILARGKMSEIIADHGPEILNIWALSSFHSLGIKPDYVPVRDADAKAILERWFLTVQEQFCQTIPGFTFGSPNERGEYMPAKHAVLTLEQYRISFSKWLASYHVTTHSELNASPNEELARLEMTELPAERYTQEELDHLCLSSWQRRLDKGRVKKDHLSWHGDGVADIAQRLKKGQSAIIYFDPCNLATVWVAHPDTPDDWHEAIATHPEYQNGLTLSDHMLVLERLKAEGNKKFNEDQACLMLLDMNEYIKACEKSNAENGLLPKANSALKKQTHPSIERTQADIPRLNDQLPQMPVPYERQELDNTDFQAYQLPGKRESDDLGRS